MGDDKKSNFELLMEEALRGVACNPPGSLVRLILSNIDLDDKTNSPTEEEMLKFFAAHDFSSRDFAVATEESHPELLESYNRLAQAMGIPTPPPLIYVNSKIENALKADYLAEGQEKQAIFYSSAFDSGKYTKEEREALLTHELAHYHLCHVRQDEKAKEVCEGSWFDNIREQEAYADYMSLKFNGREGIEGLITKQSAEITQALGFNGKPPALFNKAIDFCDPHFSPESRLQNLRVMAAIDEAFKRQAAESKTPDSTPQTKEASTPSKEDSTRPR